MLPAKGCLTAHITYFFIARVMRHINLKIRLCIDQEITHTQNDGYQILQHMNI